MTLLAGLINLLVFQVLLHSRLGCWREERIQFQIRRSTGCSSSSNWQRTVTMNRSQSTITMSSPSRTSQQWPLKLEQIRRIVPSPSLKDTYVCRQRKRSALHEQVGKQQQQATDTLEELTKHEEAYKQAIAQLYGRAAPQEPSSQKMLNLADVLSGKDEV